MSHLTRNVDGNQVKCTQAEEDAILAEWAEADRPRTAAEVFAAETLKANAHTDTKRSAKAQSWVNFKLIKDPTLYSTPKAYWDAIVAAFRDKPWQQ